MKKAEFIGKFWGFSWLALMCFSFGCQPKENIASETKTAFLEKPSETTEFNRNPSPTNTWTPAATPMEEILWRKLGPSGEHIGTVAVDPVIPSTLYAGGVGKIYKSVNGGETWEVKYTFTASDNEYVSGISIDLRTPSTLFAAIDKRGVVKSMDAGETWREMNVGLFDLNVLSLAMNPQTPTTLYLGTFSGVFKSDDGGMIWKAINRGMLADKVSTLAINPVSPSTIYAGHEQGGVYGSVDGGETWNAFNDGLLILTGQREEYFPTWVLSLAINPKNPEIIYLGGYGVYQSRDGGGNWSAMNTGLAYINEKDPPNIFFLAVNPSAPESLYAVTTDGLYRSMDGGNHWIYFGSGLPGPADGNPNGLAFDSTTPATIYIGTDCCGVYTTRANRIPVDSRTPDPSDCSEGWSRLTIDGYAMVKGEVTDPANRVRSGSSLSDKVVAEIYPGTVVKLTEGPVCADGLVFWRVTSEAIPGGSGWTAEGDLNEYWLVPYYP